MLRLRTLSTAIFSLAVLAILTDRPVSAQTVECPLAEAEAILETGEVKALILNDGHLFWNRGGQNVYEVPSGSGNSAIFDTGLLIAGYVDGTLRADGGVLNGSDFRPGPISPAPADTLDCQTRDRLYQVSASDISALRSGMPATQNVMDWPADLGAPVIDGDGNPDNYDPLAGDEPALYGDETVWWVMNDTHSPRDFFGGAPLGLEIQGSAFGFDNPHPARYWTFYRYRIRNTSRQAIRDAYIGFFIDVDLGAAFDDFVGSDSTLGLSYVYNADNDDDGNYGAAPPAIGFHFLKGPGRDMGGAECTPGPVPNPVATNSMHVWKSGRNTLSDDPLTSYNQLRSINYDGTPLRDGGIDYDGDEQQDRVQFALAGDPVEGTFWSHVNYDGEGNPADPVDQRNMLSTGPFCLGPGGETELVMSIVWARGDDNFDSVTELKKAVGVVAQADESVLQPTNDTIEIEPPPPQPDYPFGSSLYPNPANRDATLRVSIPRPMDVRIEVFDTLGRRVMDVSGGRFDEGDRTWTLPTADWPPGVYLVRMQLDHITETRRLVVVR